MLDSSWPMARFADIDTDGGGHVGPLTNLKSDAKAPADDGDCTAVAVGKEEAAERRDIVDGRLACPLVIAHER